MSANLECRLTPITDMEQVGRDWRELQHYAKCSYFLSWGWIGTWIKLLPLSLQPMLLVALESGRIVGLAVAVTRPLVRHYVLHSKAVFINKTGDPALDSITIEYNGLLAEPNRRIEVTEAAIAFFLSSGWDEVFLDAAETPDRLLHMRGKNWRMTVGLHWRAFGVDLAQLRSSQTNYVSVLRRNTRSRLRRALRTYEKLGPLHVEVATGPEEMKLWFDEMRRLNDASWMKKGLPGAFSNPFMSKFHHTILADRCATGEIQLLRVGFGKYWIGYLYNFLWDGAVLSYQCGFDYNVLPKQNWPGAVTHYAAVEFNRRNGAQYYDFLGGENQQKVTLATRVIPLDWIVARRASIKFQLEDIGRLLRQRIRRGRNGSAETICE